MGWQRPPCPPGSAGPEKWECTETTKNEFISCGKQLRINNNTCTCNEKKAMSEAARVHCMKTPRATARFCFRCWNKLSRSPDQTEVEQKSRPMQQLQKCVFCQRELETGQPFCDECGADQKMGELLKLSEHDAIYSK